LEDRARIRQHVIDWLDDNYHFGDAASLIASDDQSWIEGGILDSVGFVSLVLWFEELLGLQIELARLTRENFDSMNKVLDTVLAHPDYRGLP
jgi:acyl carrier protein